MNKGKNGRLRRQIAWTGDRVSFWSLSVTYTVKRLWVFYGNNLVNLVWWWMPTYHHEEVKGNNLGTPRRVAPEVDGRKFRDVVVGINTINSKMTHRVRLDIEIPKKWNGLIEVLLVA
ncbi:hypothetical protein COLO4_16125 [Corchorus olitorius]|uniref:Uncharacterized protein n=1 Tax=Corchorus olitorius TaxID=93759 RepID=A0A1R3JJG9_9ROSI|nr:hypothetical protein COLO4_16125 [Corchorus olitorius]